MSKVRSLRLLLLLLSTFFLHPSRVDSYVLKPLQDLMPIQHALHPEIFSEKELARFDGSDDNRDIYVAIRGIVFDVTRERKKFGRGGQFNALAGRDASRAIAKMSFDPKDLTHDLTGLTDSDLQRLDEVFDEDYQKQFPVQGFTTELIGENEFLLQAFGMQKDEL